ncbi:MAG: sodium:solute symporter [Bacteroidaceae bacterium]|nr:sodium:solute symporter [Bacteroidaceae bacterium]
MLLGMTAGYFVLLLMLSIVTGRRRDNDAFFRAGRRSPWWAVAFGMIGASVSGVTFVSVPGMVGATQMTYLQTCMGFVLGYATVAFVLLPVYYRLNLTTIYTYLHQRFGPSSYRTGASFFFVSKLIGASIRLYLVCFILQEMVFSHYGVQFGTTVFIVLLLIWLYTRNSGISTIVWSDCLQTVVLLTALVLIIVAVCRQLGLSPSEAVATVKANPMSRVFVFDDPGSKQYFWKQFVSGIFIVIVMTGLDQDMMQKNLTCKTLGQSQLNMCVNGMLYLPVNLLFMSLGVLLYHFCDVMQVALPASSDALLPSLCSSGMLGQAAMALFTIGIVAAAFSSADSAMTSLTTCFCVDLMQRPDDERLRRWVHPAVGLCFFLFIMLVKALNNTSVIDAVYTVCSYTYGPLLGLFTFGLCTKRMPRERWVPIICILSPIACYVADVAVGHFTGYRFGYELLMCNGLLTFLLLLLSSAKLGADDARSHGHV